MIKTIKYLLNEVKRNWRSWSWWRRRYAARILPYILMNKGTYVLDEEFDNLIILDACRYDIFRELNIIEGKLECRISRGSTTKEFLLENFGVNRRLNDIVYVTANPFVNLRLPNTFHKIYPVWNYGWNNELNTVHPSSVVKEAMNAYQKHPSKRLIIHFMQPHAPFLGMKLGRTTDFKELRNAMMKNRNDYQDIAWWDLVEGGELDIKEIWSLYKENLKIVLPHVKKLIAMLPGITVVTSDHGNLFGERSHILYPFKEYGHHSGLHVKQLVLVPWLVVDREKRGIGTKKRKNKINNMGI